MSLDVIRFCQDPVDSHNLPLLDLPELKHQRRKKQALRSMPEGSICGADTETVEGRVWLFSTEHGCWEIETFGDLLAVLYNLKHRRLWKQGRGKKRKTSRGLSTYQFFFYNLQFDAQAILRLFDDSVVDTLLMGDKATVEAFPDGVEGIEVEVRYLEGKMMEFKPKNWRVGIYKVGPCKWWDISQFYGKQRLKDAAAEAGLPPKIERCFDGSLLDATRFDDPDYRDFYREDIEAYAIHDAVLAGELTRLKRSDFVQNGVRFIQPYSLANVAQRAIMDTPCCPAMRDGCECDHPIPTINDYGRRPDLRRILKRAHTAYAGGWFETAGSGTPGVPCTSLDLASAYPYVMYHMPNTTKGYWVQRDSAVTWWDWCEQRQPFEIGFAEAAVLFDPGMDWHPLMQKAPSGTLVGPRFIRGWFTADELVEARKWPHSQFIIGEWIKWVEDDPTDRPFRPFVERFYEMKMNSPKESVAYAVAKVQLNSAYGKTRQAVNDIAGTLWNPLWAATITGATRARLAELIRVNDYTALSVATDGVIFRSSDLRQIPNRPRPACHNLGQWEIDGEGDLLIAMSGVYSMRKDDEVETTFRGSASYFLRPYQDGGLFRFCAEHEDESGVSMTVHRPWSAKEARFRSDYSLMNRWDAHRYTIRALGDSTKRLWPSRRPRTFGDLATEWWPSTPHRQVEGAPQVDDEWLVVDE